MLYLTEGDYINAGLSALSIIPGADAFTKTGKASKVLGNGIVESGLKHLDNVADGIKKLVKKADDAIDLEKHLPKKQLTEEAETFAKKADKVADDVVEDAAKSIKGGTDIIVEVNLSKSKYPESAKHIEDAIANGHPEILTIDRTSAKNNRRASLNGIDKIPGKDLDEYPPAMSREGGKGASVRGINSSDNRGSGSSVGHQLREYPNGTKYRYNITE